MYCTKCSAQLPDNVKFCIKCGAPVAQAAPVQPAPAQTAPAQTAPVQTAPAPKKKSNAPVIIVLIVLILAVIGVFCVLILPKLLPDYTVRDFSNALYDEDYSTAFEISQKLDEKECEEELERYITDTLDVSEKKLKSAKKKIDEMFEAGFKDEFEGIFDNYSDGDYDPETDEDDGEAAQTAEAPSTTTSATTTAATTTAATTTASTVPETVEVPEEVPLSEQAVGFWKRELSAGKYEYVIINEDGTGFIYSDIVSAKPSDTNPKFNYHDGTIEFTWKERDGFIFLTAPLDPYCFVAYQGYAAPDHISYATCFGEKKGSHNYTFAYDTEDEYTCDMLGLDSVSELYSYDSLTRDFWNEHMTLCDLSWFKYFYDYDSLEFDDEHAIDYDNLLGFYNSSPELKAQYEDADQYHFVLFTDMVVYACGYEPFGYLEFNMEEYERVN